MMSIGKLYTFQGKSMYLAEIAKLTGIHRQTIMDRYQRTQNMDIAVAELQKSLPQRYIPYHGEMLSLMGIAKKEHIKFESLKKYYLATNSQDIDQAVKDTKAAQLKRHGEIPYHGQLMSMTKIAQLTGLERHALSRYYAETNDVEKAIQLAMVAKEKQNGTIEYQGQLRTITGIATLEHVKHDTLKKYYDVYGNINKAVFLTKENQKRRQQALLRGKSASYNELSKYFGMSAIKLEKMIEAGYTPEQIERKSKKGVAGSEQLKYDEDSLYHYCLKHSYNYWVISYLIKTYHKTPEAAIQSYLANGQSFPAKWIYEKYDVLFKHLMLNFGIDSNRIIKIMKSQQCGIEQALEEYVFITHQPKDFKPVEINWLKECYAFLSELKPEEIPVARQELYLDDREMALINEKGNQIEKIKRQLLLFEFAEVMDQWPEDELNAMMEAYAITPEEQKIIKNDLYKPFTEKVINPKKLSTLAIPNVNGLIHGESVTNGAKDVTLNQ